MTWMYGLGNRLWHTDASFQDPPGRYSMLSAKVVPPVAADTEFADMRAAYDSLPDGEKARLEGLRVHHSIAYSRQTLGFEFSENNMLNLKESKNVCVVALSAIQYSLFMMSKAKDPKDFGRDQVYTLQCPDPDTRVIYEISRKVLPE